MQMKPFNSSVGLVDKAVTNCLIAEKSGVSPFWMTTSDTCNMVLCPVKLLEKTLEKEDYNYTILELIPKTSLSLHFFPQYGYYNQNSNNQFAIKLSIEG